MNGKTLFCVVGAVCAGATYLNGCFKAIKKVDEKNKVAAVNLEVTDATDVNSVMDAVLDAEASASAPL